MINFLRLPIWGGTSKSKRIFHSMCLQLLKGVRQNYYFSKYDIRKYVYKSTSTLYNVPSIVTTMHQREQTIYLQLINKNNNNNKQIYLCLV